MTDAAVARWIKGELESDAPRAPSLIVTVWGDALAPRGNEYWLSTLLRLAAPFRINERAVRTGVYRLHRSGWLAPRPVGRRTRYRLTDTGREGFERAFHRVYEPPFVRWDGHWDAVVIQGEAVTPALRKRLRDELAWAGFGQLASGVMIRPHRVDRAVVNIGAAYAATAVLTAFVARDARRVTGLAARVEGVWALAELAEDYRKFLARFSALEPRMKSNADAEQAFVVRTLLMHAYRRVRLRDPQLPREVLPAGWPAAEAYRMARNLYRVTTKAAERFVDDVLDAEGETSSRRRRGEPRFKRA
ncbi:MAG TPA: PaaX family transcriptional regulator C-terminal domain-containing protein [Casimicrobiaceae bacterium]|nr:PaaX family transcriptional regulator C-terminal domain-containing protein [Casimicrobiaceae bacterium]